MRRKRALKVVLVVLGLLFSGGVLPVMDSLSHQNQSMYTFDMMLIGVTLIVLAPAKQSGERVSAAVV